MWNYAKQPKPKPEEKKRPAEQRLHAARDQKKPTATLLAPPRESSFTGAGGESLIDRMRRTFEHRLGRSLGDVHIHPNSEQPAQFDADGYTVGTDVFLRPQHEEVLEHELTHVVQQKAGLVAPTGVRNGQLINDSPALEQSADTGTFPTGIGLGQPSVPVVQCSGRGRKPQRKKKTAAAEAADWEEPEEITPIEESRSSGEDTAFDADSLDSQMETDPERKPKEEQKPKRKNEGEGEESESQEEESESGSEGEESESQEESADSPPEPLREDTFLPRRRRHRHAAASRRARRRRAIEARRRAIERNRQLARRVPQGEGEGSSSERGVPLLPPGAQGVHAPPFPEGGARGRNLGAWVDSDPDEQEPEPAPPPEPEPAPEPEPVPVPEPAPAPEPEPEEEPPQSPPRPLSPGWAAGRNNHHP